MMTRKGQERSKLKKTTRILVPVLVPVKGVNNIGSSYWKPRQEELPMTRKFQGRSELKNAMRIAEMQSWRKDKPRQQQRKAPMKQKPKPGAGYSK